MTDINLQNKNALEHVAEMSLIHSVIYVLAWIIICRAKGIMQLAQKISNRHDFFCADLTEVLKLFQ